MNIFCVDIRLKGVPGSSLGAMFLVVNYRAIDYNCEVNIIVLWFNIILDYCILKYPLTLSLNSLYGG